MFKKGISFALLQKLFCEQIICKSAASIVQAINHKKSVICMHTICLDSGWVHKRFSVDLSVLSVPLKFKSMHGLGTYIAASYVKWIEAAGGRVVPLIAGSNQNFTQVCISMFDKSNAYSYL